MKIDYFKRINTALLFPEFYLLIQTLVNNLHTLGHDFYAISAYRSYSEQEKLYAQGRTTPGKIVTNAKGGQSAHQFGIAVDFCKDADLTKEGLQPDWDLKDYEILAVEATKLGLEAAYYWKSFKEGPHIQLKLPKGVELKDLDGIFKKKGLEGIFAFLTEKSK